MPYIIKPTKERIKIHYLIIYALGLSALMQWLSIYYIPFLLMTSPLSHWEVIRWELLLAISGAVLSLLINLLFLTPTWIKNKIKLNVKNIFIVNLFISIISGSSLFAIGLFFFAGLHWSWLIYFHVLAGLWIYSSLMSYSILSEDNKRLDCRWIVRNSFITIIIFSMKWLMPDGKLFYLLIIKSEAVPLVPINFIMLSFISIELIFWISQFLISRYLADNE
jgi:hypothetical protein